MKKGSVIQFRHKGGTKTAVIEDADGKSGWKVTDERGQTYKVAERDVVFEQASLGNGVNELGTFLARVTASRERMDIPTAWEFLNGQKATTLADLAELLVASTEPWDLWAAREAVEEDRIHFKERGSHYEVRTADQVRELGQAAAAEAARLQSWQEFGSRWEAMVAAVGAPSPHPWDHRPCIWHPDDLGRRDALESLALLGDESPKKTAATKVLEALDLPATAEGALRALVHCGHWHPHVHLGVLRRGMERDFAPALETEAAALTTSLPADPDAATRVDFRSHRVYTIDSDTTREVDDGISLQNDDDSRTWVWVHIADPGRFVPTGSPLDQEALRRSSTVYLAEGTIPMFPFALSAGPASLNQGQASPTLSFGAVLTADGAIEEWKICPGLVSPASRLSYEEADRALADRSLADLGSLGAAAELRLAWRNARGAGGIDRKEIDLRLGEDGSIHMDEVVDSPARRLVSELMILSGEIAGRFGQDHSLALPYRSQTPPSHDLEALAVIPAGPAREFAKRRSMTKSRTATSPAPHASLGLDAYVQASSPLRRYNDLATHRCIKAVLRGEASPLDADAWDQILAVSLPASTDAAQAERESRRYWTLEHLRRQGSSPVHSAVVMGTLSGEEVQAVLLFPDLGLEWNWKPGHPVQAGQELRLRVKAADPRADRLVLQEVRD